MSQTKMVGRTAATVVGTASLALAIFAWAARDVTAQGPAAPPAGPPQSAQAAAPIDLTGYWVSIVNEDWRWRMITPPKGDYASVPLTPDGTKQADAWQPSMDGRCEAYGAGGLMRLPTRVHITWEGDSVLKLETDAGQQTRRFTFNAQARPPAQRSLQGFSVARWERPGTGRGPAGPGGNLRVTTTMLRPGWLRRNGVPYSENAELTEYYDRFTAPDGAEWFVVTSIVRDPKYLNQDFTTSSHFRKEPDGSKWSPSPCRTT